jgi:4-aminobutyrate aminotransferase
MANAVTMGERLQAGVRRLAEKHRCIGDVRGLGLMVGVEFVKDRATRGPAPALVHDLVQNAFRRGLLLLGAGKSSLRLAPPLIVDAEDVDIALEMIGTGLGELA